jgi:uncharacterized protein YdeI (YjbR/CyaY-like superfamily)
LNEDLLYDGAMKPTFFAAPDGLRAWLAANHDKRTELWVGFHKRGTGRPSITWPESVDAALCFGWIDGVRKGIDDERYMIRFTPRQPRSIWSKVNIARVGELTKRGLMHAAGLAAFAARDPKRSGVYSFERTDTHTLAPAYEKRLRANAKAWAFFGGQAPWYRRAANHWVMSAKKEETREKRLATLIDDCAHGRTIKPLTRPGSR